MSVRLRLLDKSGGPPLLETPVEGGERLMDVLDESRSPVPFSCRGATCGTCLVHVVAGASLLRPAREEERAFLQALGTDPRGRLACRVVVGADQGEVDLVSYRI